jgi:hypothetical protein
MPLDPPDGPIGRADLQEALEGIEDLDLVAAIEPTELFGAELVRLRADPDLVIADRRALDALGRPLVEHAGGDR